MPKASIIIPVYNKEKYLEETLSQVDKQQEDDLEVILIDDDSLDHSMEIIRDFTRNTRKQTKVIKNSRNMGVAYSRNLGIEESKSDYITFLDADDLLDKNFMSIMLEKAERNPAADYIYGLLVPYKNKMKYMDILRSMLRFHYNEGQWIDPKEKVDYIYKSNISCSARLYKKSSIKNLRFTESCFEDYEFFLDTLASGLECIYTTKPIYGYRLTKTGKYQNSLIHINSSCLDLFDIYDRIERKYPNMDARLYEAIRTRQISICEGYLEKVLSNVKMTQKDSNEFKMNYDQYLYIKYLCDNGYTNFSDKTEKNKQNIKKIATKY